MLFSCEPLIQAVWNDPEKEPEFPEVAIRSAICDLRAALRTIAPAHGWMRTERGVGYALMVRGAGKVENVGSVSRLRGRTKIGNRPSRLLRSIQAREAGDAHWYTFGFTGAPSGCRTRSLEAA